jgi:hypothetical protein
MIDDVSSKKLYFSLFQAGISGRSAEKCPILVESTVFIDLVVHFGGGIVEVCHRKTTA